MTAPPLPASPCLRVNLNYQDTTTLKSGNRFYLSYAGSAPSAADCLTLATDIAGAWVTDIEPLINTNYELIEVDVLDIATDSGLSGKFATASTGSRAGTPVPNQCAINVEYDIARRYRGGKPRLYLPGGTMSDLNNASTWEGTFVTAVNAGVTAFFAAIDGFSVGATGELAHVNLSYYKGFTNITNSSGRERAVPTYRASALVDPVTGYATKVVIGSQKRRRTSINP